MRIGVTGHSNRTPASTPLVADAIREALTREPAQDSWASAAPPPTPANARLNPQTGPTPTISSAKPDTVHTMPFAGRPFVDLPARSSEAFVGGRGDAETVMGRGVCAADPVLG